MCHKLFQAHSCGHTKEVCTTPCAAALANTISNTSTPTQTSIKPSTSTTTLAPPPYTSQPDRSNTSTPSLNTLGTKEKTAHLCAQFFARYLPAGNHPCFSCYMHPKYAALRGRWMRMYAEGHPGVKSEDVERLSGVEGVGRKVGLVNVMREMDTAESWKREGETEGEAGVDKTIRGD